MDIGEGGAKLAMWIIIGVVLGIFGSVIFINSAQTRASFTSANVPKGVAANYSNTTAQTVNQVGSQNYNIYYIAFLFIALAIIAGVFFNVVKQKG